MCLHYKDTWLHLGFPGGASGKEPDSQCRRHKRHRFHPWVGKIPWRRAWQPIPVFLPGESPWTEEPGGLQSTGSQRIGHDWSDLACTHVIAFRPVVDRTVCAPQIHILKPYSQHDYIWRQNLFESRVKWGHKGEPASIGLTGCLKRRWDFSSGPVLRPWTSTAGGSGLILGWGTKILYAVQHGQKIKWQQQTKRREGDIGTLSPRKDHVMRMRIQPSAGQVERSYQKPTLPASWSWTSSLQDYEKINSCCLCYPVWGILYGSPVLPHPLPWTIQEIWRCLA